MPNTISSEFELSLSFAHVLRMACNCIGGSCVAAVATGAQREPIDVGNVDEVTINFVFVIG